MNAHTAFNARPEMSIGDVDIIYVVNGNPIPAIETYDVVNEVTHVSGPAMDIPLLRKLAGLE